MKHVWPLVSSAHFSTATFRASVYCIGIVLLGAAALPNLPAEFVVAALFPVCFLALGPQ